MSHDIDFYQCIYPAMRQFKLINVIGIDGAGKTTLAVNLAKELSKIDNSIEYRYCQYFAKLLYPIKKLAKFTVMRKTDEFKNYDNYNSTKKNTSSKYPVLANAYAFLWLIDYMAQSFVKVLVPIMIGKKLIIDRYIFDIAVNLSLTTNNELSYAEKAIRFFTTFMPKPDLVIFIDISEDVAFERKDDIQDVEYLSERRVRYQSLSEKYNFIVLEGDQTQDKLLSEVMNVICDEKK